MNLLQEIYLGGFTVRYPVRNQVKLCFVMMVLDYLEDRIHGCRDLVSVLWGTSTVHLILWVLQSINVVNISNTKQNFVIDCGCMECEIFVRN